jgi:hypothetical protein
MGRGDLLAVTAYGALFLGGAGQGAFLSPAIKPHVPAALTVFVVCVPWFLVFFLTFFKRPLVSPRGFCNCLIFAMAWFAAITIGAELLNAIGFVPPPNAAYARGMSRTLMHAGWLSFLPLIHLHNLVRPHVLDEVQASDE